VTAPAGDASGPQAPTEPGEQLPRPKKKAAKKAAAKRTAPLLHTPEPPTTEVPPVKVSWRGIADDAPEKPAKRSGVLAAVGRGVAALLEAIGLKRKRNADGSLQPRAWKRLGIVGGSAVVVLFLWTMVHIVPAGSVGVPITLGKAGGELGPGLQLTVPFTQVKTMSTRTQNYTMTAIQGEGQYAGDDSVAVLGRDGGAANVDATVLFRLDPGEATRVYEEVGTDFPTKLVRPAARTCIRAAFTKYDMVEAATSAWEPMADEISDCMRERIEPRGIQLLDFQLREVRLADPVQQAIDAKVAAQQQAERQRFERQTAEQQADISRINAIATADSQQILACGGTVTTVEKDGQQVQVVTPNPTEQCDQAQLTPQYLQYTYIQALKQLVDSPNNSTIILPMDQNLTPLLNIDGTTATTTAPGG
jgi:regulator of protease activity HflC (stomatin/prohibitin superfamily)